ncbi:unnamed protein product [Kluyveromyces dobzhanskii CBS 2104]|uniref:Cytidine deaminase n=1 Tax=Kluyveromyces dobzhanskii CBS 2104 TaxID=1427455 RepID=A0A0A8L724_9SACH|nr:unnamed protein product [Kluyveromyces dobzhanskii CBS 2104]
MNLKNCTLDVITQAQIDKAIAEAQKAKVVSYSPYSKFRVGCCIVTEDGSFISGSNVENASYGAAICAERTAIVKAVTSFHRQDWVCIAINSDMTDKYIPPCGICRQMIREFGRPNLPVIMTNCDASIKKIMTLDELLPESFGPEHFD